MDTVDVSSINAASVMAELYVRVSDELKWLRDDLSYAEKNVDNLKSSIAVKEQQLRVIEQLIPEK